ncbi:MAG: translation initiation factor eIF-2B [Chromatiaceae bacterium]|nr:translation initiation factor eIF-2B [Gammaproteobacteria bacterium]MCB1873597.1 translation initiation factor eIF-2B [Gammaproteobacteria bacterium]MCB1879707.1 translation initiation factor eIF-2B [Gammaproteobacteria bacterium]MCB1905532.1 translation initiation factor eIF-2B [Gammaproteobacteria bacterium]MCP5445450.1 translation initiation factor eIF-2B [Chromatiaceae bacterium]
MDDLAFETALRELRADRVQGASQLARRCLDLLARSAESVPADTRAELIDELLRRCDCLIAARASMAPIENLLTSWKTALTALDGLPLPAWRSAAAGRARDGIRQSQLAVVKTAEHTAACIGADKCIITHSLSSTVLAVFEKLKARNIRVMVSESRPLNEGVILARQLAEWHIPCQLLTDAQLGLFAAQADLALLGADSLLPDGSLINKAGSYLLALAVHDSGVPLYVCCESFKRRKEGRADPELEEMDASELGAPNLPRVRPRNIYFDITPARLISRWIDETGVHAAGRLPV